MLRVQGFAAQSMEVMLKSHGWGAEMGDSHRHPRPSFAEPHRDHLATESSARFSFFLPLRPHQTPSAELEGELAVCPSRPGSAAGQKAETKRRMVPPPGTRSALPTPQRTADRRGTRAAVG